jgi:hypothetical protein
MITVACVYKPGNGFTSEYVYRLRDGVKEHCKAPHRFVCLTNERLVGAVETIPLVANRPGWWNKLELFRKNLFDGPVVYSDLDVMLVGDVTDIFTREQAFLGMNDFNKNRSRYLQSAFMAWDGRLDFSHVYETFTPAVIPQYEQSYERWGDQGWIMDTLNAEMEFTADVFPGRIVSYKQHVRRQGFVPKGASIVMFHGKPRPADVGWRLP